MSSRPLKSENQTSTQFYSELPTSEIHSLKNTIVTNTAQLRLQGGEPVAPEFITLVFTIYTAR